MNVRFVEAYVNHSRVLAAVLAVVLLVSLPIPIQAQSNQPPVASFRWTYYINDYTFDARRSYDPDGSIVEYSWDFGDGEAAATTSPIITHTYTEPGEYYVFLTVIDNLGGHSTTWRLVKTCGGIGQPVCPE